MKRLFAVMLCMSALSPLAFGLTRNRNAGATAQQEQKETKSYDDYIGQYEVTKDFILTITNEKGKLMGQPTGDEKVEFKAEKEADTFFSSAVNARLKFVRDETGAVTGVIVTLGGKDFQSKKIK